MTGPTLHVEVHASLQGGAFTIDVALEVPAGVTVLFGPSGAGKSRTLACITGFARPDRGRIAAGDDVWFDSERGIDLPVHARRVALVFQSLALFPHMSALENVTYGVPRDLPAARRIETARAALARMRVDHVAARRPRSLSGGEAQRVALARAFASSPRALLLDEPFSALDEELKSALLEETREYVGEAGIPTLLVTHDRTEAARLADHVLVVEKGRIVRRARASEVFG